MTATQQLEIRFPNIPMTASHRRRLRRNERARWWFDRMRVEVDRAWRRAGEPVSPGAAG